MKLRLEVVLYLMVLLVAVLQWTTVMLLLLTRQHLNQHKDEVQKGGKVTLLRKGWVVTNSLEGTAPNQGDLAYLGHSGNLASSDIASDDVDADGSSRVVGRFLSDVDQYGYAKVFIDLPNTNL
jgi:hypothetical protein